MQKVLLLVLVALVAVSLASDHCNKFCVARSFKSPRAALQGSSVNAFAAKFNYCVDVCRAVAKLRAKEAKEPVANVTDNSDEVEEMADAPATGASLVTTASVNARSGACTTAKKVTTVAAGASVKYAGQSKTACGYTWYYVSGSFGKAWMASKYLKAASKKPSTPSKKPSTPSKKPSSNAGGCNSRQYPLFKQCDGKWGGNRLGSSSTVCKVGCLMSSVSMALNALGKKINGQSANPGTLNAFLKSHGGYTGNLFIWGSVGRFGLKYRGQISDRNQIKNYVCQGKVVVLNVNGGGHWVLATGISGSNFRVNDPGYSRSTYAFSQVVRAGIFDV